MFQTITFNPKLLTLGQHILVKKLNESTTYKSIVEEINDASMVIALPIFQGLFMHSTSHDTYTITAHCETGIFTFDCHYIAHVTIPVGMIKVSIPIEMSKLQNRNNVRINDFIELCIQSKDSNAKIEGSTKNISAGGMLIITHGKMSIGDEFSMNFKLSVIDKYVNINIKGKVVRIAESLAKTQKNLYGIQFLEADEKVNHHLTHYVFKRQAQIIKMMKEA